MLDLCLGIVFANLVIFLFLKKRLFSEKNINKMVQLAL